MKSSTPPTRPRSPDPPPLAPRQRSPVLSRSHAPLPSAPLASRVVPPRAPARDSPSHKPADDKRPLPSDPMRDRPAAAAANNRRNRDTDPTVVDQPHPPSKRDSPPRTRQEPVSSHSSRETMDAVPKAPRAMGTGFNRIVAPTSAATSPTSPTFTRRGSTTSEQVQAQTMAKQKDRSPPPRARDPLPPIAPRGANAIPPVGVNRYVPSLAPPSGPRKDVPRLSGTNNIPIGARKPPPAPAPAPAVPPVAPAPAAKQRRGRSPSPLPVRRPRSPSPPSPRRERERGRERSWDESPKQQPPPMSSRYADEVSPRDVRRPADVDDRRRDSVALPRNRREPVQPERGQRQSRFDPTTNSASQSLSPPSPRTSRDLPPVSSVDYPSRRPRSPPLSQLMSSSRAANPRMDSWVASEHDVDRERDRDREQMERPRWSDEDRRPRSPPPTTSSTGASIRQRIERSPPPPSLSQPRRGPPSEMIASMSLADRIPGRDRDKDWERERDLDRGRERFVERERLSDRVGPRASSPPPPPPLAHRTSTRELGRQSSPDQLLNSRDSPSMASRLSSVYADDRERERRAPLRAPSPPRAAAVTTLAPGSTTATFKVHPSRAALLDIPEPVAPVSSAPPATASLPPRPDFIPQNSSGGRGGRNTHSLNSSGNGRAMRDEPLHIGAEWPRYRDGDSAMGNGNGRLKGGGPGLGKDVMSGGGGGLSLLDRMDVDVPEREDEESDGGGAAGIPVGGGGESGGPSGGGTPLRRKRRNGKGRRGTRR